MNNFSKRIISGLVYVAVFLSAILFSKDTYVLLMLFFASVCLWEFSNIIKTKSIVSYAMLAFLGAAVFLDKLEYLHQNNLIKILLVYTLASLCLLLLGLFNDKFFQRKDGFSQQLLPVKYVVLPFFFLMLLPFVKSIYTPSLIIATIVIIWTNDSFAYLVGKNFGKRKLFEKVSPKKTIEGFIGGLFFAVLVGVGIGYYSGNFPLIHWAIIAILISVFGTLGDLVESKFKRKAGVKDSGTIMPGHGGLLDRLDSLFFLAPFLYLYIHFFVVV